MAQVPPALQLRLGCLLGQINFHTYMLSQRGFDKVSAACLPMSLRYVEL